MGAKRSDPNRKSGSFEETINLRVALNLNLSGLFGGGGGGGGGRNGCISEIEHKVGIIIIFRMAAEQNCRLQENRLRKLNHSKKYL